MNGDPWVLLDTYLVLQCPKGHIVRLRRWDMNSLGKGYLRCEECPRVIADLPAAWPLPETMRICPPEEIPSE